MELIHLPLINSILNFIATILLTIGFILIKSGKKEQHQKVMWAAFSVSGLFLINYLVFHYQVGSVKFMGEGLIRPIYFTILITHIILAAAIVPMILLTLTRAIKKNFVLHRKIAKITWPLWMYVSVTGVIIYLFMHFTGSYDLLG
ncbi:DUF420 domain-containing protein [bacterium]|nr:MAG: DUF420 domain-containing protein [bacterium]